MLISPMAERNKETILEVLADYVDDTSSAFGLELGSGTGQHVVHFAQALPTVTWQPSEMSPASQQSISAYIRATKVTNVREPLPIDVSQPWEQWAGLDQSCCDFIVIINLLHMTNKGLEPFAINGIIIPECNVQLDEMLQARNPEWGLRDVEELRQLANANFLRLERMLEMPEYTKCLIFRRREL
ncbi:Methyltransferase-like 26 B [Varanus komodoensis]|nr:Methyltransferase-like 26 B [Varanus komodoensis]